MRMKARNNKMDDKSTTMKRPPNSRQETGKFNIYYTYMILETLIALKACKVNLEE